MSQNSKKKLHIPTSKAGKILTNLLVTLAVGGAYFYVSLPALNLQSNDFYSFMILLCVVYVVSALITSGFKGQKEAVSAKEQVREYFRFIKQQCLPVGVLLLLLMAVALVGQVISMPIFRAGAYRDLLAVEDGEFAQDIGQISFSEIPTLDRNSADYLGDRQMGTSATWSASLSTPMTPPRSTTRAARSGSPPSPMPTWSSGSPTGAAACPPM